MTTLELRGLYHSQVLVDTDCRWARTLVSSILLSSGIVLLLPLLNVEAEALVHENPCSGHHECASTSSLRVFWTIKAAAHHAIPTLIFRANIRAEVMWLRTKTRRAGGMTEVSTDQVRHIVIFEICISCLAASPSHTALFSPDCSAATISYHSCSLQSRTCPSPGLAPPTQPPITRTTACAPLLAPPTMCLRTSSSPSTRRKP